MADKFEFDPKKMDINDLMRMLDEMQSRTRAEEVEELLIDTGYQPETYSPPTVGDGYAPGTTPGSLAEMLITPEDIEEMEEQRRLEREARQLLQVEEEEDDEELPPRPENRRNPFAVLWEMMVSGLPRRGDSLATRLIKSGVLLGVVAVLAAVAVLLAQMVLLPMHNRQYNNKLAKWFDPTNTSVVSDTSTYPEGMLAAFKRLYRTNKDVKGWLSFHSEGEQDFLNIEYPVVQGKDNTTYVNQDFHGRQNPNGTLFFDEKCTISNESTNQSLILYGNTMGNGQMLSGLNQLVSNEAYAREAYQLTLSTLYDRSDYYVFAVLLRDKEETVKERILPLHNRFITSTTFLDYVQDLRDRSLFNYPTDVNDTDSIVLLVTDMGKMNGVMDGAQVVVAARRARPGELNNCDVTKIGPNEDVLMPYRWYKSTGKVIPDIYRGKEMGQTQTTLPTEETTDTTDTTDTTTVDGTTSTDTTTSGSIITGNVVIKPVTTTTTTVTETTSSTATEDTTDTEASETDPTASETQPSDPTATETEETDPTEIQE